MHGVRTINNAVVLFWSSVLSYEECVNQNTTHGPPPFPFDPCALFSNTSQNLFDKNTTIPPIIFTFVFIKREKIKKQQNNAKEIKKNINKDEGSFVRVYFKCVQKKQITIIY